MASAAFELAPDGTTYGATPQEVSDVGATVRCRLLSVAGVTPGKIRWSIEGTNNDGVARPTITPTGTPNGQIVSFVIPAGENQAYIVQCEVNGGPDFNGDMATRARGKFYVLNVAGRQPIAYFETTEANATHGTFQLIDEISNTAGAGAVAAAGIGTIASPGILRGISGSASVKALHVGGFWSLADAGGGSFYWDATSTTTDDGGTIIRPTLIAAPDPGRWLRIYSGPLQVDWFGAVGDANTGNNTTGTDDTAAIQTACTVAAATAQRLVFSPKKVYKCASFLDLTSLQGLVLDGLGGFRFTNGARLKFTGAQNDCCIRAFSVNGLQIKGLTLDASQVTLTAPDFTYANAAARTASTHLSADLGMVALDTDTGLRWRLYAVPSSWLLDPMSIIDTRHKHWNAIGGTEGGDSANIHIEDCVFAGNSSNYLFTAGVRLSQTIIASVKGCNFTRLQNGVVGVDDQVYGNGYSNVVTVDHRCSFTLMQDAAIYNPGQTWTITNNTFEPKADATMSGVVCDRSGCVALKIVNNWHGDGTGGTAYKLFGVKGLTLDTNYALSAGTAYFAELTSCDFVHAMGNSIYTLNGYLIHAGTPCYGLYLHDYMGGAGTYLGGTNYSGAVIHSDNLGTLGGLRVGDQNTLTGLGAMAVGRLNSAATFALAVGFTCTAPTGGLTTGNAGVGTNNSQRTLGGGQKFGTGGSQGCELVCCNKILAGATTALLGADQLAPCMTLTTSKSYKITARFTVSNVSAGIHYTHTLEVNVRKTSGGTATITSKGGVWVDYDEDPGATGITVDAVLSSNNLNFQVTNPTGSDVNASAYVSWVSAIS
jgi:hypothetical protein